MRHHRRLVLGAAVALLPFLPLGAQTTGTGAGAARTAPQQEPQRQALERRFRQQAARILRRQLGLTNDQMRMLSRTNQHYEALRRTLAQQERSARQRVRVQMAAGDSADARKLSAGIDTILSLQRGRVELLQQEQQDLSRFLTPLQRARYLAIQEQLHRRIEALRQSRGRGPDTGRAAAPPAR